MKKKNKWIKRVVIALIVLILLAGIGVLGYFLYGRPVVTNERSAVTVRSDVE